MLDINECEEGTDSCHINASCSNTNGSFACSCAEGFSGDGMICTSMFNIYYYDSNSITAQLFQISMNACTVHVMIMRLAQMLLEVLIVHVIMVLMEIALFALISMNV